MATQVIVLFALLLAAVPARAGDHAALAVSTGVFASHVADYWSTKAALRHPGVRETNPLLAPLARSEPAFAAVKLGLGAGASALTYYMLTRARTRPQRIAAYATAAGIIALNLWATGRNLQARGIK